MGLRNEQSNFTEKVGKLICYAYSIGYELTFGDAFAVRDHKENSFHYQRLAIDLNLFIDGVYQMDSLVHTPLGIYWESIGGTWGGRFTNTDGNHYSWGEVRQD